VTLRSIGVTNAYPRPDEEAGGRFFTEQLDALGRLGVDVHVLLADRATEGPGVYRKLPERLREMIREVRPDVVHTVYGGVMAGAVAKAVGDVPYVSSYVGNDLFGEGEVGLKRKLVARYAIACSIRAARRANEIIVVSRRMIDALPADVDRDHVWVLPHGVDLERSVPLDRTVSRQALGWSDQRKHVLFPSARDRSEKRFWLAQAAVQKLGGDVELHWLEDVRPSEVPKHINASDVVLLTSTHEGSPNVLKETLACNVAVVSVDVGDVPARLAGIDGCYVADATPADLAAKLRLALEAGRVKGREAVAHLDINKVAERMRGIYESAINGGAPPELRQGALED
jgi:teichuronic acid biosynthesis glycosyltransferase TuaC